MIVVINHMFSFRISQNRLGHEGTGSGSDIDTVQFIHSLGQSRVQIAGVHDELTVVNQIS